MKNIISFLPALPLLLFFVLLTFPAQISEAGSWRTCNGTPVILEGDPPISISTISFPNGSIQRQDLDAVIALWNGIRGMHLEFQPTNTFGGSYSMGNGRNEIVVQNLNGPIGLTTTQRDACTWWFESQSIQEFDIEINASTSWIFGAPPENNNSGNSIRYTAVHELGHALGLLDNNNSANASVMKQSLMGECWCGSGATSRVLPLTDDVLSSRALYPFSNSHRDITACAFEIRSSNQTVVPTMTNTTINLRRGSSFSARATFGNLGNRDENFDILFVLSTNNIISTSDRIIASGTGWGTSGAFHTFSWTTAVPSDLPPGTYFLGLILDPNNTIPEQLEGNNFVVLQTSIRVN